MHVQFCPDILAKPAGVLFVAGVPVVYIRSKIACTLQKRSVKNYTPVFYSRKDIQQKDVKSKRESRVTYVTLQGPSFFGIHSLKWCLG